MVIDGDLTSITICDGEAQELHNLLADGAPTALIMRGVSGAGKSTLAMQIGRDFDAKVHSTDAFHTKDGKYCFQPQKLGEFHKRNREAFEQSLREGAQLVICDNTNIKRWEFEPYIDLARKAGYRTVIALVETDPQVAHARNLHGVPEEKVMEMYRNLEI